jgi:hypothetical protein
LGHEASLHVAQMRSLVAEHGCARYCPAPQSLLLHVAQRVSEYIKHISARYWPAGHVRLLHWVQTALLVRVQGADW